jgi:uncharacterized protein YjdB
MTVPNFRPITLTPATAELKPGETQDLTTTGGPVKSWSTSNSTVATLVGAGEVRGRTHGDAVITVKGGA